MSAYKRGDDRTQITLRTDWDTTETVTLEHPGAADAARHYRLGGVPFRATDWARIEAAPGVLHAGLRAAAWVCADGRTPPVVDWRPGDPGPRPP